MAKIKVTETKEVELEQGDLVSLSMLLLFHNGKLVPCLKKWETVGNAISDILFNDKENSDLIIINK